MNNRIFAAALGACVGLFSASVYGETAVTFKSVSITLPDSDPTGFPSGPSSDTVSTNCTACHSSAMILNQPVLSKAAWTAEVTKMRNVYKAPVDDKDVDPIVGYLMQIKGAQ